MINFDKILTYNFFLLPHVTRIKIVNLLKIYDEEVSSFDSKDVFLKIKEQKKLSELWDLIKIYGDERTVESMNYDNPFIGL